MSKQMSGAEMVVQAMLDNGVEYIFGYPGGAVLPIYDAIFQQEKLHHILVRHEQGATHAAEGRCLEARPWSPASANSARGVSPP